MDDALLGIVLERLDRAGPSAAVTELVVAACDSTAALDHVLGNTSGEATPTPRPSPTHTEPVGAYLSAIAESLELVVTGTVRRLSELSAVWKGGWPNMHVDLPTEITAELYTEDHGQAVVRRTWAPSAAIDDGQATVQFKGQPRTGIDAVGWNDSLAMYRPFLAHTELEAFFGRPTELYELVASVLSLGDLVETGARLAQARKARQAALRDLQNRRATLLDDLAAIDDPRAAACHTALSGDRWDLDTAETTATGSPTPDAPRTTIDDLRALAQLTTPSSTEADTVAVRLEAAADRLDDVAGTDAARAAGLAELLRKALHHHHQHGDGPCPVCGRERALDTSWHAAATDQIARLDDEAKSVRVADQEAAAAGRALATLTVPPPAVLTRDETVAGIDLGAAQAAWRTWASLSCDQTPDGLTAAAGALRAAHAELASAVAQVAKQAGAELATRDDAWAPLATRVAAWCADARSALVGSAQMKTIQQAERWLKDALDEIRNDRFLPLADKTRQIWAELRQESNVELDGVRLEGSGNRRQLAIDVTVDGSPSPAMGVMSQGEINALALSVFIPRATLPDSPFRFLVLDDPVQAMDPAKVDGLARVLGMVAESHQVVVFTHDARLPTALRDLDIKATVLEISRRTHSQVDIRPLRDPVRQSLDDARTVAKDDNLADGIKARVVGGFCRAAAEAAFIDVARHKLLTGGAPHDELEDRLAKAQSLTTKAGLALFGDPREAGKVRRRLEKLSARHARVYRELCGAGHEPTTWKPTDLVAETRWFADEIARVFR